MTIYNSYEYNDCGVCVNPDKPHEFGSYKGCYFSISLSETPRGWVCGFNCGVNFRGQGLGCWYHAEHTYHSRSKAIIACAGRIKRFYDGDKGAAKAIAELDRIIAEESGKAKRLKQYSIFDYL